MRTNADKDKTPQLTLEQRRAADAWACAQGASSEYTNLAKGLPALIMNSGLMQVMAFLQSKGAAHQTLGGQMRCWLAGRGLPGIDQRDFPKFMDQMLKADSLTYRTLTAEALAWLRWLRQMAPARETGDA